MNPFIPIDPANLVIVDARISKEIEINLRELGLEIVKTIKCEDVDESIAYHPDIVIHPIDHNTLVISPNVFEYYKDALSRFDLKLIRGGKALASKYPGDVAYNVARLGNVALHNFKYTDPVLKYYLKKHNTELIDIKQGYSKCSLAIVGRGTAITSDDKIYKKLRLLGFDILLVRHGNIRLEGQKYGFIGGTNGIISHGKIIFSGVLSGHPDLKRIGEFLSSRGIKAKFLSNEKISDIGTMITLNCKLF